MLDEDKVIGNKLFLAGTSCVIIDVSRHSINDIVEVMMADGTFGTVSVIDLSLPEPCFD